MVLSEYWSGYSMRARMDDIQETLIYCLIVPVLSLNFNLYPSSIRRETKQTLFHFSRLWSCAVAEKLPLILSLVRLYLIPDTIWLFFSSRNL